MKFTKTNLGDWNLVKKVFLSDYDYRIQQSSSYKIQLLKQKIGEGVVTFFARVSQAVDDMYNGMPITTNPERADERELTILHTHKNLFVSRLRDNL